MNTQVILDNGFKYQRFYGGQLVNQERINAAKKRRMLESCNRVLGEYCTIRNYMSVEKITITGTGLIKVGHTNPHYLTLCGYYKVVAYNYKNGLNTELYYNVYKCVVHRKNLGSTFGNYAQCKQGVASLPEVINQMFKSKLI